MKRILTLTALALTLFACAPKNENQAGSVSFDEVIATRRPARIPADEMVKFF